MTLSKQETIHPQSSKLGVPSLSRHFFTKAAGVNRGITPQKSSASGVQSTLNLAEIQINKSPVQPSSAKLSSRPLAEASEEISKFKFKASQEKGVDGSDEKCKRDNVSSGLDLYGRPKDIKHAKLQIDKICQDLSTKSSDKYTHFSTLVYLKDNHCGSSGGSNITPPNEPPKPQDRIDETDREKATIKLYGKQSDITDFKTAFGHLRANLTRTSGHKYTNLDVVDYLCKNYNDTVPYEPQILNAKNTDAKKVTQSPSFQNNDISERTYFLASWVCIDHVVFASNRHGKLCDGDIAVISSENRLGFTCKEKVYECQKCKWEYRLFPTPRYKGRGISDFSAGVALHTSGGQTTDIARFTKHLGYTLPSTNKFQNKDFRKDVLRKVVKRRATAIKEKNLENAIKM